MLIATLGGAVQVARRNGDRRIAAKAPASRRCRKTTGPDAPQ